MSVVSLFLIGESQFVKLSRVVMQQRTVNNGQVLIIGVLL